jgi:two-component system OmpR family response regulator
MAGQDILVVDDDASIRDALCDYLERHGYRTRAAGDGRAMDAQLEKSPTDLLILDLMMPGEDGLAICRRLGPDRPPILMLSALGDTSDRIVGLEVGADDYLPKPFEPRELLARVRAVLRRRQPVAAEHPSWRFGGWCFDPLDRRVVDPQGCELALTASELALLRTFLGHPRRVLSRNQLLDFTSGQDVESFDRSIFG